MKPSILNVATFAIIGAMLGVCASLKTPPFLPDMRTVQCPTINILYTYVNGSDPGNIEKRNAVSGEFAESTDNRFRDLDTLRYSLRSVEKFAPWVNKIFLYTDDQVPNFLDTSHPRVVMLSHKDVFLNKSNLPTFNSNAIEASFTNLPKEVGPCFIYLNDDMMFMNEVFPSDFYSEENGLVLREDPWLANQDSDNWHKYNLIVNSQRTTPIDFQCIRSNKKTNEILNEGFGEDIARQYPTHGPYFFAQSVLEVIANILPDELQYTSSHAFRADDDLAFPFLHHHVAKKFFKSTLAPSIMEWIGLYTEAELTCPVLDAILNIRPKTITLNDQMWMVNEQVVDCTTRFMQAAFPEPSEFEIPQRICTPGSCQN